VESRVRINAALCLFAIAAGHGTVASPSSALAEPENGLAAVYSLESGQETASGQTLNPEAFTAAHRTLPFGTSVKVTNKQNGRSVTVIINDRGPFSRGRVIDLTPAAARALGCSGLVPVTLAIEAPNPPSRAEQTILSTLATTHRVFTSIGMQLRRPDRTQSWFLRNSAICIASHAPATERTTMTSSAARLTSMRWR
jgi:rare lipoprotein A